MEDRLWTVITVTYNSSEALRRFGGRGNALRGVQWIVVDNASTDDSIDVAKELGAEVIALTRNVGFAAANNEGLKRCATSYVLFANPDLSVESASLQQLAETIDRTSGLVSPQLLNLDGSEQRNQRGLPFLVDKLAHRGISLPGSKVTNYIPNVLRQRPYYIAWSMGAAVAARTETVSSLGGWDTRYFLYYEDHELGLRAWKNRVPVVLEPRVRWVHGWARETKKPSLTPWRRELKSAFQFYRRHYELLLPTRGFARKRHALLSSSFLSHV